MEEFKSRLDLSDLNRKVEEIRNNLSQYLVGQHQLVEYLLIALLADGHVLIEGVPGVAKTLTAKLLAKSIHADFRRIQFTPDLMPGDITGTPVYNSRNNEFEFRQGPLFANIVLADEINRAPAKTQAALFEAMEERQITVDGKTYPLDLPFMVLATQNPVEQEGTYRLPEAQLDRFIFKLVVNYPNLEEETAILQKANLQHTQPKLDAVGAVLSKAELAGLRDTLMQIHVEEPLFRYIATIVSATRQNPFLYLGASPRASIAILRAAKACACINGRDFVSPNDIKHVVAPVLRHRVVLTPEKEMEGVSVDTVIHQLVDKIEIPR